MASTCTTWRSSATWNGGSETTSRSPGQKVPAAQLAGLFGLPSHSFLEKAPNRATWAGANLVLWTCRPGPLAAGPDCWGCRVCCWVTGCCGPGDGCCPWCSSGCCCGQGCWQVTLKMGLDCTPRPVWPALTVSSTICPKGSLKVVFEVLPG